LDEEAVKPCIQDRLKELILQLFSRNNILLLFGTAIAIYFSILFGLLNLFNIDAVRLMVEVEATVLGFYGLIYINILNSINLRADRQLVLRNETDEPPSTTYPFEIMENFIQNREEVRKGFTTIFSYIISSMILGIASIAIYNMKLFGNALLTLNIVATFLFFYSFYFFVELMRRNY